MRLHLPRDALGCIDGAMPLDSIRQRFGNDFGRAVFLLLLNILSLRVDNDAVLIAVEQFHCVSPPWDAHCRRNAGGVGYVVLASATICNYFVRVGRIGCNW